MKRGYLVDSDVLIDFLRGQPEAVEFIKRHFPDLALSVISVAEIYAGIREVRCRNVIVHQHATVGVGILGISAPSWSKNGINRSRFWNGSLCTGRPAGWLAGCRELCALTRTGFPMPPFSPASRKSIRRFSMARGLREPFGRVLPPLSPKKVGESPASYRTRRSSSSRRPRKSRSAPTSSLGWEALFQGR